MAPVFFALLVAALIAGMAGSARRFRRRPEPPAPSGWLDAWETGRPGRARRLFCDEPSIRLRRFPDGPPEPSRN